MNAATPSDTCILLNVGVVTKGDHCLSVMHHLQAVQPSRMRLRLAALAVVGKPASRCKEAIVEEGIALFEDYRELLSMEHLNLILELTGSESILSDIVKLKRATTGVLDRQASMLLFDINHLYSREDRHESEITLATSFASTLLEASPDGVLVIDKDYRIINCNQSPIITGNREPRELLGKHCFEIIHGVSGECDCTEASCPARETQSTGKPSRKVHEILGLNNTTQICQVTAYPIFNRFGEVAQVVLTIRDMTKDLGERIEQRTKALQKDLSRLVQEDRLTSLGRLVASVCHEINNPITSIVTFIKLVLSMIRRGSLSAEEMANADRWLELSFREAMRCGCIVKNLLTFARPKSTEAKTIDLHEMVNTILILTGHQMELANVRCNVALPTAPFTAWGDYAQIQQCLLNLIFNAIDAMPGGGAMTISGGVDQDSDFIWLSVADTGYGIDPNDMPKIFEPFFTTKTDGKGVGLGLSMVYGIIREHHGTVEVDSEPGKGATFKLRLPRSPVEADKEERGFSNGSTLRDRIIGSSAGEGIRPDMQNS